MTYEETLEYLFTRLPMYQRVGKIAYKKDLTNTLQLMDYLGNPHHKFKSIHIAGTNGKGTSAHGISAILQTAGYKTGLYTSPHLKSFTERIRIDGIEVNEQFVVDFVERIRPSIDKINPSFFEITVAMAFEYFASQKVDIAVVETGLGGRLDSTNVIIPEVCLITNIGYDHMDMLGDTLEKIAAEKSGIIKKHVPVIIGETLPETAPIFEKIAKNNGAKLIKAGISDWKPKKLTPNYLQKNMGGIESVIQELVRQGWNITSADINEGVEHMNELTGLKGRLQVIDENPLVIADVSHNAEGIKSLFEQITQITEGKLHLIFGSVKDKDLTPIFSLFPNDAMIYWTQSQVPRALSMEELAIQGVVNGIDGECFLNVNEAINHAREKAGIQDTILVTGSTFIVAEINEL
ncbi:dihydrofolate synthase / folylpolyglutamate synthase [Ekhidna lutea]|uniref:Dihydrofolate synthase/folylpolyglutamate synthase n=1 Tax=Ekhidna lutea TaxID=447679 RepID=A0A239GVZ2_EKHLU|nr:folylpolyglutamate synthase/dihydrofolate synthase family protein [Ekhidna lutea]SNS72224.1 dihydrofolate synthase / folylpolyglutamate synthase [Ekhidna lutea]